VKRASVTPSEVKYVGNALKSLVKEGVHNALDWPIWCVFEASCNSEFKLKFLYSALFAVAFMYTAYCAYHERKTRNEAAPGSETINKTEQAANIEHS
jgi:hypothetical protein